MANEEFRRIRLEYPDFTYHDVMASAAKNYLIDKYEFSSFEVIAYKSTIFVDEDISNCNNLWFKKCTDDKTLQAKYYFINICQLQLSSLPVHNLVVQQQSYDAQYSNAAEDEP